MEPQTFIRGLEFLKFHLGRPSQATHKPVKMEFQNFVRSRSSQAHRRHNQGAKNLSLAPNGVHNFIRGSKDHKSHNLELAGPAKIKLRPQT